MHSLQIPDSFRNALKKKEYNDIKWNELSDFEFTIFANSEMKCSTSSAAEDSDCSITGRCSSVKRLGLALKYHDLLRSSELPLEMMSAKFVKLNEEIYKIWREDINRLIQKHGQDIEKIHLEWKEKYGFANYKSSFALRGDEDEESVIIAQI